MRQRKLTDQQRLDAVHAYLAGAGSYQTIAEQFQISSRTLRDLVALYQSQGEDALQSPSSNNYYPPELKRQAVEDYQSGRGSQRDICKKYNIRARTQLRAWIRQYSSDANLQPQTRSTTSRTTVPGRKTTIEERVEIVCYCLANGKDYDLAINTYHISYQQVYSWVRKYQDFDLEGLLDKRGKRKDPAAMTHVERLQSENKLLQAEIQRLQTENTALKKLHQLERRWG